jgi:hypothetical protein
LITRKFKTKIIKNIGNINKKEGGREGEGRENVDQIFYIF